MNRKDFIKSILVGSVITPTLSIGKPDVVTPVVVDNFPIVSNLIEFDGIGVDYEYNYGVDERYYLGDFKRMPTGCTVNPYGISMNKFQYLHDEMRLRTNRDYRLKFTDRIDSINGRIVEIKSDGMFVSISIILSKPYLLNFNI